MSTDDQAYPRGVQRNRPENVDALASKVISVLHGRQKVSFDGLRQFVLDHVLRAVLSKSSFSPDSLLAELRGYRLTVDAIIDLYVPTTARILGDKWVDDKINFAEVTVAVMRLQSLLSEASATTRVDARVGREQMATLVLVPQGEQHFLGASVLSAQLRRSGCDVGMSFDEDFGALTARLIDYTPDMVLISCARWETLESAANTVQTIRKAVAKPPLIALGGALTTPADTVIERTGVDIVTSVAEEAVAICARRVKSQNSS